MDPKSWSLEGSQNGTYWFSLDDRSNIEMPSERNKVINYYMQKKS